MTFPRERNGWVDDGKLITASNRLDKCPNCGSSDYRETISLEECKSCGLRCDYWGGGANQVYDDMMAANARAEEEKREDEWREWLSDESNWRY